MLHNIRPHTEGITPILFSEAVSWINFYCDNDYTFDDRVTLMEMFQSVESSYLQYIRKKSETDEDGNDSDRLLPSTSKKK